MDVNLLPSINAGLNATAAVFLVLGYVLIRRGKRNAHRAVMLTALACSVLFLTSYLTYHYHTGSTRFPGSGVARTIYLSILITHTVLAATVPFLAGVTVYRALRGRFDKHRAIARWTLPIWLYVSVTGVVIYWMLYRIAW